MIYTVYAILATVWLLMRKGSSKKVKNRVIVRHFIYLFFFLIITFLDLGYNFTWSEYYIFNYSGILLGISRVFLDPYVLNVLINDMSCCNK